MYQLQQRKHKVLFVSLISDIQAYLLNRDCDGICQSFAFKDILEKMKTVTRKEDRVFLFQKFFKIKFPYEFVYVSLTTKIYKKRRIIVQNRGYLETSQTFMMELFEKIVIILAKVPDLEKLETYHDRLYFETPSFARSFCVLDLCCSYLLFLQFKFTKVFINIMHVFFYWQQN